MLKISEVQADLAATQADYDRLSEIVTALKRFMGESNGEDRSFLTPTLMRFEVMLVEAEQLIPQIERLRASLVH